MPSLLHEDDFVYNARLARSSLREKRRCDLPLVGPIVVPVGTAKWFFCARFRRRSISVPRVPTGLARVATPHDMICRL